MLTKPYKGCVYLATCRPNGKIYIGKSIHGMEWRRKVHNRYSKSGTVLFLHALRKYGPDAFVWCELFLSDDDRALMAAEADLIADYRSAGFTLYNMTDGGDGCAGRKVSPEQLEKMKQPRSEQAKANIRAGNTPEVRARKAEAMRGRIVSEETRRKSSEIRKGTKLSPDTIAKIQASRKNVIMPAWTPERRAKMEAAWEQWRQSKVYKTSPEVRAAAYRNRKDRKQKGPPAGSP